MHGLLPIALILFKILSRLLGREAVVVATTNPPLIQWTATVFAFFARLPIVVWYEDAHPELEAIWLEEHRLSFLAQILRQIDRVLWEFVDGVVTLDRAMEKELVARSGLTCNKLIAFPWVTFVRPAKPLTMRAKSEEIKLIYAGNYGASHDLLPLVACLNSFDRQTQGRCSLTFVGMSKLAQARLQREFLGFAGHIVFLPRFAALGGLLKKFSDCDFGIVSLSTAKAGLSCPSKAFTYVSQGLPLLYIGPASSMSDDLIKEGWGIGLTDLTTIIKTDSRPALKQNGKIYPDPRQLALSRMQEFVITTR